MLTQEQVEELMSVSDNAAIFGRVLLATHKFDLDYLAGFASREPEAYADILTYAPLAIGKAKEVLKLLEKAEKRLQQARERSMLL